HLVMNDGRPVLPSGEVSTLVDRQGRFRNGGPLLVRYPLLSLAQLRAEWRAQIERFIADTGRPPSHLDLHCHYPYVFPAWFRLSVELAEAYGRIPVRLPFDDALEQKAPALSASYGGFPIWFILRQGRRYRRMVDRRGLSRTNYWESSFSQDGARTAEVLLEILGRLPEGSTEILCHPGTEGWRAEDYRALMDPRVRRRIEERGIRLIGYADLRLETAEG
ncbi:MAG TPA: ChbG/HpnK family deacetylase, partial [Anaerolineae bacterium]|nr:ChbG/HpnK family deacetylase [Anaerolineae bacterium]